MSGDLIVRIGYITKDQKIIIAEWEDESSVGKSLTLYLDEVEIEYDF